MIDVDAYAKWLVRLASQWTLVSITTQTSMESLNAPRLEDFQDKFASIKYPNRLKVDCGTESRWEIGSSLLLAFYLDVRKNLTQPLEDPDERSSRELS